jgi:hypothetical protein
VKGFKAATSPGQPVTECDVGDSLTKVFWTAMQMIEDRQRETMSEQNTQSAQALSSAQMFQFMLSLMMPQAIQVTGNPGIALMVANARESIGIAHEIVPVRRVGSQLRFRLLS